MGERPNQPKRFLLPKREYGKKLRRRQKTIVKHAFHQLIAYIPAQTHEPIISAGYIIQMAIQYSIWLWPWNVTKFNLRASIFLNFPGGMPPAPLKLACYTCWLCFAQYLTLLITHSPEFSIQAVLAWPLENCFLRPWLKPGAVWFNLQCFIING